MEKYVPLISSNATGPLGVRHLPRLWLKVLLHATGRLPEAYRHGTGGADERTLDDLGIDRDAFIRFVESELPTYLECEAWVRKNATHLDPESIAKHNEITERDKPEAMAAAQRKYIGIDDPNLRNATILNDLDDWVTVHAQVTKGAFPPLAASSLNAALTELLKEILERTGATRATIRVEMPQHGFRLAKPAAEAKRAGVPSLLGEDSADDDKSHPIYHDGKLVASISVEDGTGDDGCVGQAAERARAMLEEVLRES